jgi:hypothetical protein
MRVAISSASSPVLQPAKYFRITPIFAASPAAKFLAFSSFFILADAWKAARTLALNL